MSAHSSSSPLDLSAPADNGPVEFRPFAHLGTVNAPLYRSVMAGFVAAKRRFVVHLRIGDVRAALGPESPWSDESITAALNQLVAWGNLRADPDTARVTTVEDFHRARFLYQFTPAGEAAEQALAVFDDQLGRRGSLQAVALTDIADGLRALRELLRADAPDVARGALLLRDLAARLADLADNAQAFMGSLQRTIDLYDIDVEAFRAYKDRLIEYLERFIKDLVNVGAEISLVLLELDAVSVDALLVVVAGREATDLVPDTIGEGGGKADDSESAYVEVLASWRERWRGLREWFVSSGDHASQARLLRERARKAIPDLLAVVAVLNERRGGRSNRSADFRDLAVWFAEAPDDDALHTLWRAAFGLNSARHLALDAASAELRAERPVPASVSWADAPPLRISPQLRRTGSYERRGRPNRVIDRSELRRALAARAAAETRQTEAARVRLITGGPITLADVGELDRDAFGLFLSLLGDALAARRPGNDSAEATTSDGALRIRLTTLADARTVEIRTSAGVFRGPDHQVDISDLRAADVAA